MRQTRYVGFMACSAYAATGGNRGHSACHLTNHQSILYIMEREEQKRGYCIEFQELGVWETYDTTQELEDAILLASTLCQTLSEDRIRISTPDYKLI